MKYISPTFVTSDDPIVLADKNAGKIVCATSLIISESTKRIVLVLNNKMGKINPPGGKLQDIYDDLCTAAVREIEEEVGIQSEQLQKYDFLQQSNGDIFVQKAQGKQVFIRSDNNQGIVDYLGVFMTETEIVLRFLNEIQLGGWVELVDVILEEMAKKYLPNTKFEDCFFKENLDIMRRLKI